LPITIDLGFRVLPFYEGLFFLIAIGCGVVWVRHRIRNAGLTIVGGLVGWGAFSMATPGEPRRPCPEGADGQVCHPDSLVSDRPVGRRVRAQSLIRFAVEFVHRDHETTDWAGMTVLQLCLAATAPGCAVAARFPLSRRTP
jgi:hypothetical protein